MKRKAISIQQPWAWAILHAGKDIENRTWRLPTRNLPCDLVIHAGKRIDSEGLLFLRSMGIEPPANLPTGCLVGEVTVFSCWDVALDGELDDKWSFGPYCWMLVNPVAYWEPIPCKGQLKIFEVEVPDA